MASTVGGGGTSATRDGPAPDICVITTVHAPFDARIFFKECVALHAAGFRVCLIAPGAANETRDGIAILALPPAGNRLVRMVRQPWRAYRLARAQRARAYHLHDPELLLVAVALRWRCRAVVVFDVHEDAVTDMLSKPYLSGPARRVAAAAVCVAERWLLPRVDAVVAAHEGAAAHLAALGVRSTIIHNYVAASAIPFTDVSDGRPPCVGYVGGITPERGIVQLLTAARLAQREVPALRVVLVGRATPDLAARMAREFADVADYRGPLPQPEAVRVLAETATIGVATYLPYRNYLDAEPTKVFEYMALGLPIVCSDFPLWKSLVVETGCGIAVDATNPEAIARGIRDLLGRPAAERRAMARRGRLASETRFNWDHEAARLVALYRDQGIVPTADHRPTHPPAAVARLGDNS